VRRIAAAIATAIFPTSGDALVRRIAAAIATATFPTSGDAPW